MTKWNNILGSWERIVLPILNHPNMRANLALINNLYKANNIVIYPKQENVFKAFKECPYDKLKVVIILQDPYTDGSATGIALANSSDKKVLSPSLRIVKDTIVRKVYKGRDFNFDPTLVNWAKQGILMLNSALTVEADKPLSHIKLWDTFTVRLLLELNSINSGIVYCLWGKQSESFRPYINEVYNNLMISTHPVYAAYKHIPWECDHFIKINEYLIKTNNTSINW